MKNVITALLVTTFALGLSSGVRATTCLEIGKAVVDSFVSTAKLKIEGGDAAAAYNNLINTQKATCETSVGLRNKGADAITVAKVISMAGGDFIAKMDRTNLGVASFGMTQMSASLGYAFGE